jgi:hypothetical protein
VPTRNKNSFQNDFESTQSPIAAQRLCAVGAHRAGDGLGTHATCCAVRYACSNRRAYKAQWQVDTTLPETADRLLALKNMIDPHCNELLHKVRAKRFVDGKMQRAARCMVVG